MSSLKSLVPPILAAVPLTTIVCVPVFSHTMVLQGMTLVVSVLVVLSVALGVAVLLVVSSTLEVVVSVADAAVSDDEESASAATMLQTAFSPVFLWVSSKVNFPGFFTL